MQNQRIPDRQTQANRCSNHSLIHFRDLNQCCIRFSSFFLVWEGRGGYISSSTEYTGHTTLCCFSISITHYSTQSRSFCVTVEYHLHVGVVVVAKQPKLCDVFVWDIKISFFTSKTHSQGCLVLNTAFEGAALVTHLWCHSLTNQTPAVWQRCIFSSTQFSCNL